MAGLTRATPFLELAQLCRKVEATTKRNEKIALISTFLKSIGPEEVPLATLFLAGKAFPESDPRVLEISYATMADDPQQVLAEHKDGTAFEYKFDGARIQIHRKDEKVQIFSRRLTDVTDS